MAVAAGASGIGLSTAAAATPDAPRPTISAADTLNDLATMAVPSEQRDKVPTVTSQLQNLNQVNQLHQLTDMAAPVAGLVQGIQ